MLESERIKMIQEMTEQGRSVRYISRKLRVSPTTVQKYRKTTACNDEARAGASEVILTASDPQWQRFASVCNRLGNLGRDSPRDVLLLVLRAYTNVAEKSGKLNLKIRG